MITQVLTQVSPWLSILYVCYVAFVLFAIMNIVTGVFVDQAMKIAQEDLDNVVQQDTNRREGFLNELRQIFTEADVNQSGTIDREELVHYFEDQRVQACFKRFDLDVWDLQTFFYLLKSSSRDEDDESVDIEAFVHGCLRLKGQA